VPVIDSSESKIIIGVDGGGSRTTAAAVDTEGHLLGRKTGAGINFNASGMKVCTQNLYNIIEELKKESGFKNYDTLSIGMSALDDIASSETVNEFAGEYFDSKKILMHSDVHMALYGLNPTAADSAGSVMIVSGTGMMGVAAKWSSDKKEETFVSGGWGYLFGDEGSCFYIASEGIKAALRYSEKIGKATVLLNCLYEFYNIKNIRDLIPKIYSQKAPNEIIASFAPQVINSAKNGDKLSIEIMENTLEILCGHTCSLAAKIGAGENTEFNIGINGGLFEKNPEICNEYICRIKNIYKRANIGFPVLRPEMSAVLYAVKIRGYKLNTDFLNLK
jgi:N-acetylglucosamine kinase-like BadF-type ATPase